MLAKDFGFVLAHIRKQAGLSQEKLAELAGLDRTYISLLERGLRQPTLSTIFELAKALDTNPSDIIGRLELVYKEKPNN